MLVDLTIKGFLAETAGSAPVPGGGSISALNGAIATALTEMVANRRSVRRNMPMWKARCGQSRRRQLSSVNG